MDLKSLFKGKSPKKKRPSSSREANDGGHTIDDLIVLERFEEAEDRLQAHLKKNKQDLHAHLRLAEVSLALRKGETAVDEYVYVAEEHARDGFYDKAIALLGKAARLMPLEEKLRLKLEGIKAAKRMEHKRTAAVEGLREGGAAGNAWAMEVQRQWHHLVRGPLIQKLTEEQIRRLFSGLVLSRWEEGSLVAEKGMSGDELYLVLRGGLRAQLEPEDGRKDGEGAELRTFGPGDILGESVLFQRRTWPATVVATESTALLTLTRLGMEKALVGNSDPRGLLEVLRDQGNDQAVSDMVRKLVNRPSFS